MFGRKTNRQMYMIIQPRGSCPVQSRESCGPRRKPRAVISACSFSHCLSSVSETSCKRCSREPHSREPRMQKLKFRAENPQLLKPPSLKPALGQRVTARTCFALARYSTSFFYPPLLNKTINFIVQVPVYQETYKTAK